MLGLEPLVQPCRDSEVSTDFLCLPPFPLPFPWLSENVPFVQLRPADSHKEWDYDTQFCFALKIIRPRHRYLQRSTPRRGSSWLSPASHRYVAMQLQCLYFILCTPQSVISTDKTDSAQCETSKYISGDYSSSQVIITSRRWSHYWRLPGPTWTRLQSISVVVAGPSPGLRRWTRPWVVLSSENYINFTCKWVSIMGHNAH